VACAIAMLAVEVVLTRIPGYGAGLPRGRWRVLALIGVWWLLTATGTALAVAAYRAGPRRLVLGIVLGGLVAVQGAAMTRSVQISDDLYRYSWDGRIQLAGVDPYRYTPVDPALARFHDSWLWPDAAGCAAIRKGPGCTRINYKDAHTIYPPVAEAEFTLVHLLPGPAREHTQQLAADAAALAVALLLARMLLRSGRNPGWIAAFAWSPLAGLDLASDAHVDGLAVALCIGALLLWQPALPRPPSRRRLAAGLLVGAAIAVKLYPALVLIPLLRRGPRGSRRRVLGAAAGLVAVSYLPHVAAVGTHVVGFLPQYLKVEGYEQGSRFLLLTALGLPATAAKLAAVVILAAVALAVLRSDPRRLPAPRAALYLVGAAFLVATPVQPWYGALLVALAVAAARPEWCLVAAAAYPLYFSGPAHQKQLIGSLAYGTAALVVLVTHLLRARRGDRPAAPAPTQRSAVAALSG
jgi:hypothetical protein